MYKVIGKTIKMTRGDTVIIQIGIQRDGVPYQPENGDVIRFAMKHPTMINGGAEYADTEPILTKVIPNSTLQLKFNPQDTKDFAFGEYVYDIQITFADGSVDTFIAEAQLMLLPEVD